MPERKPLKAVALRYDTKREEAPRVVAKGEGPVADKIRALAAESGIPIREDASLVEILVKLDLDALIPPELYRALAEVLSWAYRQDASYVKPRR